MAITANIDTRAGSGQIELSAEDGITDLPTTTGEVQEISELEIDYDLEEDTEDVKNIFYSPSEFNVQFFDELGNGDSLIGLLDNYLSTDTFYLTFSFTTDDGHSFETRFEFSTKNVEADRIKRDVEIESKLVFGGDTTIEELFNLYPSDVDTFSVEAGNLECMPTKLFIENALEELVPDSDTVEVINDTQIFGTEPYVDAKDSFVVFKNQAVGAYEQENNIASMLYRLATMDGSIMGSMMGYQYMCHRNSTSNSATLTNDDVTEIAKKIGLDDYRSAQVMFNNTRPVYEQGETQGVYRWADWATRSAFDSSSNLNKDGNKTLTVYLHVLGVQPATWQTAQTVFTDNGANTIISVSGNLSSGKEYSTGDTLLNVDSDPLLDVGDVVCFTETVFKPHMVRSSSAGALLLETPLQQNLDTDTDFGNIYEFVNKQNQFAEGAVDAYANAYGANGQERFELEVLDIDAVDPYQPIFLDGSFREEYANRYIQPSNITYDIMQDKVLIEGYEIT